jgi:hypothetical protein
MKRRILPYFHSGKALDIEGAQMPRLRYALTATLVGLAIAIAGVVAPAPASAATGWNRCSVDYSCYFSGVGGQGSIWMPPTCGWWYLPYRVISVWNRGHGTIYFYYPNGQWSGYSAPIGYKGSNAALAADHIYIVC